MVHSEISSFKRGRQSFPSYSNSFYEKIPNMIGAGPLIDTMNNYIAFCIASLRKADATDIVL